MTPAELLAEHTPEVAALTDRLRRLVSSALPEATERVYAGWHGFGYLDAAAGYVCGIFPVADRVKLGFEHGAALADPDGLFTSGGSQVRYIEARPGDEIDEAAITDLIADAVELGDRR